MTESIIIFLCVLACLGSLVTLFMIDEERLNDEYYCDAPDQETKKEKV